MSYEPERCDVCRKPLVSGDRLVHVELWDRTPLGEVDHVVADVQGHAACVVAEVIAEHELGAKCRRARRRRREG